MNEALRLAAWLDAHAKYMKHSEEQAEMHKAAKLIRAMDHEIKENIDALVSAQKSIEDAKKFFIEQGLFFELSK